MDSSQNYYSILQIEANADLQTIKQAYRKKIRIYHPDQFSAELRRMKQTGNALAVQKLEQKINQAQVITGRINEAYAVLSDETDRATYDRYLSGERQRQYYDETRQQRMQHRTAKSHPHSHHNPNHDERVPWILLAMLMGLTLFVSILFSRVMGLNRTPVTTYVSGNATLSGEFSTMALQMTDDGMTAVSEPSETPFSSSDYEILGDRYMQLDQFQRAVAAYDDAILADTNNAGLYVKRGTAYNALYLDGDVSGLEFALADYTEAINIDANLADAYLARGMLYYELWMRQGEFAEEAQSDLEHYLEIAPQLTNDSIGVILSELPE